MATKVKRLFLYLAEKANHDWVQYLDLSSVNLGSGKRAIVANGVYIPKYQITVPKELELME
ncbi:type IV toxin-antitoxin system AbiEi family antitoxin domain-containing protein [Pseudidiomarina sp. CB1]|uniref:type IV toxin-antitoxin system AbiEi family antitoxin domain-containing protein n=1 Tax=Pseudidiomarina sp. CB1 TaxID=2972484 RepID=UPI0038620C02